MTYLDARSEPSTVASRLDAEELKALHCTSATKGCCDPLRLALLRFPLSDPGPSTGGPTPRAAGTAIEYLNQQKLPNIFSYARREIYRRGPCHR